MITSTDTAIPIHRLYFIRAIAAVAWAVLLMIVASSDGSATLHSVSGAVLALLVVYPLIDVAATVAEIRTHRLTTPIPLIVNTIISVVAAIALGATASHGSDAVLRVFGVWALLTGLIQLGKALVQRRRRGLGQLPMIFSGAISSLAGIAFVQMSTTAEPKLTALAGYAIAGAAFFLVSAWRLRSQREA